MRDSTKNGYVASAIVLFVGIVFGYVWLTSGKDGMVGIISLIFSLLGLGGISKPDFIGQLIYHWMKKGQEINQKQYKPYNSPQSIVEGDQHIHYN